MALSAGLLLYRTTSVQVEVLLAQLGGPFWAKREHWTIPKGIVEEGEHPQAAALREFEEETGWSPPSGTLIELGEIRQKGGKRVVAWAVEGDADPATLEPGTFEMEWPPRSGRVRTFPEVSEVRWFSLNEARERINAAQVPLLARLSAAVQGDSQPD